jgi:hypothetical protein
MRMIRASLQLTAAVAVAAGLAAPQIPALASARATPTITIKATSRHPVVTGDVWVIIHSTPRASTATIKGSVSGAVRGQVLRLYKQQWPFKKAAGRVGTFIPVTGASQSYAFANLPTLASRYQVELFASATATTPLARSATVTVYAVGAESVFGIRKCGRPVCTQRLSIVVTVPPSTLRTELAKHWFTYFGLNLSRTSKPPPPRFLHLGAGSGHASTPVKISGQQFRVIVTFSFRIGQQGYFWLFRACSQDSEANDGLNLPGRHGCGTFTVIRSKRPYLG